MIQSHLVELNDFFHLESVKETKTFFLVVRKQKMSLRMKKQKAALLHNQDADVGVLTVRPVDQRWVLQQV